MPMDYARELEAAREAVRRAGQEIMALYARFEAIKDAPADISTEADRRSQEVILQYLSEEFPDDGFCAEEDSTTLARLRRQAPRLWIIDPIDGTRGFAKKLGEFSVMVGLVERNHVRVGVVLEPALERCTFAVKHEGCWRQDGTGPMESCHVSPVSQWNQARMVRSHSEKGNMNPSLRSLAEHVYTYSAGVKLARVARGETELYVSSYTGFNSWDVCAGQILVEEAGGQISDGYGRAVMYAQDGSGKIRGTVASNGLVHEPAVAALREFMPPAE